MGVRIFRLSGEAQWRRVDHAQQRLGVFSS